MAQFSTPNSDVNLNPTGFVIDLDSLYASLARLKDSQHARGLRYSLVTILVCVVLGLIDRQDFRSVPEARRHYAANLNEAWELIRKA